MVALALLAPASVAAQPPRPLTILDVPFISQSEALCGGAAAAMLLRYWGERGLDAEAFAHLVDHSEAGIRTTALTQNLRGRGWVVRDEQGSPANVAQEVAAGRPVIALIEDRPGTFHYIVIVALTARAVVFHDPARAPFQVMGINMFAQRWAAADRWMAIVVPAHASEPTAAVDPLIPVPASACDELIAEGVRQAQGNDLDGAERSLAAALSCGGSAALRELAGIRLLQRRWSEVRELAGEAVRADPGDSHAWELLATSRFVQDDVLEALEAWNQIDQPRLDLVSVDGLRRTRQRIVERLLAVPTGSLLTPRSFMRTSRRLGELPSASATRLELRPVPGGLAELRASVVEQSLVPQDWWSLAGMGLVAAARNEVRVSSGAPTGGGERIAASWRFWTGRPRVQAALLSPAPWGGLWGVDGYGGRESFDGDPGELHRRGAGISVSNWTSPWVRLSLRGGVDRWGSIGSFGTLSGAFQFLSTSERLTVDLESGAWAGPRRFASLAGRARFGSSRAGQGLDYLVRGGMAATSAATPMDLWLAGDTGRIRDILLRAHPLAGPAGLHVERMGRRIVYGSAEGRRWWTLAPLRVGAAVFADAALVASRTLEGAGRDLDIGLGLRLSVPGLPGVFRLDAAKGMSDGATGVSLAYEP